MIILNHFALVLLLACVAQQVFVIDCQTDHGRKGNRGGKGKESGGQGPPPQKPPSTSAGGKAYLKGRFITKDKTQCTWLANEEDTVTIGVICHKGGVGFNCEYTAKPATCATYASNVKMYWRQIARGLKKQKNICQDTSALIKTAMCKRAHNDAHFKLSISTPPPQNMWPETTTTAQSSSENNSCAGKTDQKQLAEEYCSGPWVTLCNFIFTMVQSEDC